MAWLRDTEAAILDGIGKYHAHTGYLPRYLRHKVARVGKLVDINQLAWLYAGSASLCLY